ncbi:hypothetical protein OIO90_003005 [Microbotryomycetes sp. JL221]|nr:hypothetical protein OIO90_003005 [Microbotryomycetes sp. JL221]
MATRLRQPPPELVAHADSTRSRLVSSTTFLSVPELNRPNVDVPYVLHVSALGDQGYLLGGSDDTLRLFATDLSGSTKLQSTQQGVTSIAKGKAIATRDNVVFVTAKDGTVAAWDVRNHSKEAFKLKSKTGAGYLTSSQSSDGSCLAVGAELHNYEATIDFWDLRAMKLAHTYTEAHSDDITHVEFHPSPNLPHLLLSASVDGLLNTYDVRVADEDDSVLSTSQVGTSLASAGWMSLKGQEQDPDQKGVWCATTIETMQFWDVDDSSITHDLDDIRDVALDPWRSEYLIGAQWNAHLGGVCISAGTQAGDVAIMNLSDPSRWVLERLLPSSTSGQLHGHSDIVRCIDVDSVNGRIVTGGEDGKVCLWSVA